MRGLALAVLLVAGCGDLLPSNPCMWCYARRLACEEKVVVIDGKSMLKTSCLVPEQIGMRPLGADGGAGNGQ